MRAGNSPYKFGRSTFKEHYLLELKTFLDAEAEVVGFVPLYENQNEPTRDALGHQVRSSKLSNLIAKPKLGAITVRMEELTFNIGSGFTDVERYNIWANQSYYLGRQVTFKYQPHGTKENPRCPIFKGFRLD